MTESLLMTLKGNTLVALNGDWLNDQILEKMKQNENYMVILKRTRSIKHNRKFFALLNSVVDNHNDIFPSLDYLMHALKQATGLINVIKSPINGELMLKEGSISFEKMTQDEFNLWSKKCIEILCAHLKYDIEDNLTPDKFKRN